MEPLLSADALGRRLGEPGLVVLDATYFALEPERDARAHFAAAHVPGARFLDLETLADADDPLPGMRPPVAHATRRLRALGVNAGDRILLYDDAPHRTAARAWWLLRSFGLREVALLDGGLGAWRRAGLPLERGEAAERGAGDVTLADDRRALRDLGSVRSALASGAEQVLDARSPERFTGAEADPRPGVAPGHMPGAINLRYTALFEEDGRWKRGERLADAFRQVGIDIDRPVVTTCGSGVTAAILLFGLHLLGRGGALYDGSWSEWGAHPDTPKEVTA